MPSSPVNGGGTSDQSRGIFLVIEGTDGAGKSTQYDVLRQRLENDGYELVSIHFPRYEEPSSYFVRQYLSGEYGSANEVGPYTGSIFYALDRYQAAKTIRAALETGKVVLCDRYIGSNMIHQGTKFNNPEERRGYFIWLDNLEFQMLGIPRPDLNFVLSVPYEIVAKRLAQKEKSSSHVEKDVHEVDTNHMRRTIEVAEELVDLFPKDFTKIESVRGGRQLDIDTIHKMIWEKVEPLLPPKRTAVSGAKTIVKDNNPYITKTETAYEVTSSGEDFLQKAVTNTKDDVYAFTGEGVTPITAAAAMARLSRRGDDMRITILDEFAHAMDKDAQLLQRVITAYGDDSVQQLVGTHIVVENASNLLTKKLEWGRLASYLEQSTRYIYFDKKDRDGKYKYFTPSQLNSAAKRLYNQKMDQIFDIYSDLVHQLTNYIRTQSTTPEKERDIAWKGAIRAQACDAIRPVLPVATKSTVGIFASGQAIESLIMHLQSEELLEFRETGDKILHEARKVIPAFLERADKPDRGGAMVAYRANTRAAVKKLAQEYLPEQLAAETEAVQLTDFWPRNELDLVADMIYEFSNLPLEEIRQQVTSWKYDQKANIVEAYIGERLNRRHRPGRAIEKAHYSFDLVCDYGIFRDLQRHRIVDDLEWQELTPRYGYEVPKLVEEAGLTEQFEKCFDISLALFSELQKAGYALEAQYATLLGHKMRWKVTYNAREAFHLHELRTSPQGHPGYRKLVQQMHDKVAEVHPLLADSMKFVNKGEDAELTRLAAEKYTQFKLNQLKAE